MKNSILLISLGIIMISLISLSSASLGNYPAGTCVTLKTILNTSAVTLSTVSYPNSTIALSGQPMTKVNNTFIYNFCNTQQYGSYSYDYCDAEGNCYVNDFTIGNKIIVIIFLLISAFLVFVLSLYMKNEWIGFISGVLFIVAGMYLLIYGLEMVNNIYTNTLAYVSLGFGLLIFIASAYEAIAKTRGNSLFQNIDEYDYFTAPEID